MNKSILLFAASAFLTGAIFTSCNTSAEKMENAENKVVKANKDLDKANEEYLTDIENYRKEIADRIAANQKSIDEFNTRISKKKKEARADYKNKIADLDKKNTDMKKKLDDYKAESKAKWEIFKMEFNLKMDVLNESFKSLIAEKV